MDDQERAALERYVDIIAPFVDGATDATAFEDQFPASYLADSQKWSDPSFQLLDRLFADVDYFVADDDLRDPDEGDLDETGLREAARRCLDGLRALT